MSSGKSLVSWGLGLAVSFLFIWAVSFVFVNSVAPKKYDPLLEKYVYLEGAVTSWRSEGWADTRIGRHGLTELGGRVLNFPGSKIVLWGDSQVEAVQVDDSKRTINVFNERMNGAMTGFAVGAGGLGVADYYFDMPRYARLAEPIAAHVILLNNFDDVIPGKHYGEHGRFTDKPYSFVESKDVVSYRALKYWPIVNRFRLEFLYFGIYEKLKKYDLKFGLGANGESTSGNESWQPPENLNDAWSFLLKSLKNQAGCQVVFVYAPFIPYLDNGRVQVSDQFAGMGKLFEQACEGEGVGYIDLTSSFIDFFKRSGKFPRGFFNSEQGNGHLNEHGHRLVADALVDYFKGEEAK